MQQQAAAAAVSARQLDKLQTRVRLGGADAKVPIRQLQESSGNQADAMMRLAEQQARLVKQVAGAEEVIAALQGVGARQFKVCIDALTVLKEQQAKTAGRHVQQVAAVQDALGKLQLKVQQQERRQQLQQLPQQPPPFSSSNGQAGALASSGASEEAAATAGGTPADPWRAHKPRQ